MFYKVFNQWTLPLIVYTKQHFLRNSPGTIWHHVVKYNRIVKELHSQLMYSMNKQIILVDILDLWSSKYPPLPCSCTLVKSDCTDQGAEVLHRMINCIYSPWWSLCCHWGRIETLVRACLLPLWLKTFRSGSASVHHHYSNQLSFSPIEWYWLPFLFSSYNAPDSQFQEEHQIRKLHWHCSLQIFQIWFHQSKRLTTKFFTSDTTVATTITVFFTKPGLLIAIALTDKLIQSMYCLSNTQLTLKDRVPLINQDDVIFQSIFSSIFQICIV